MENKAGDPGAFAQFDLDRVGNPLDVYGEVARCGLAKVRDAAEIKMLSARKTFSMWATAPIIGEYLDGVCLTGLWEAWLASEFYDGKIAASRGFRRPTSRKNWKRCATCRTT